MDVSIEHLQTLLEGRTVEEVIEQKKLYEIDLRFLSSIECTEGQKLPGPTCLLYVKNSGDLVPIAIQIMPEPASDNPVSSHLAIINQKWEKDVKLIWKCNEPLMIR